MSTLKVKYLRWRISRNRCPTRPGITHDWAYWEGPDITSWGGWLEGVACTKCRRDR